MTSCTPFSDEGATIYRIMGEQCLQIHRGMGGRGDCGDATGTPTGTIYKVRKDGSGLEFLYTFQDNGSDGVEPNAPLLRGSDGALYGTTFNGSGPVYGSVFRIKPWALGGQKSGIGFIVRLEGSAGQRYTVEATDLLPPQWQEVVTVTNLTGTAEWLDTTGAAERFYRARVQ